MMKKRIVAVLAAVLVLSCAACGKNVPETNPTGGDGSTYDGVGIQVVYIETTEEDTVLHVQWRNDTEYPIMYGEMFGIQRWEQDQWVDCPMNENTAFISIGYQLERGKMLTKPYALNWAFGELAPGQYRFLTSCSVMLDGKDKECKLSAEFALGETMDNKGNIKGEFSEPPMLVIGSVGEAITGTYNWFCAVGDGTWSNVCADSSHPLLMEKHLEILSPGNAWVDLNFEVWPDDYTVRCWPGSAFGNPDAKSEAVMSWNNSIQLKMADYIYEVTATWNDNGNGYYGTVTYVFYAAPAVPYDVMPIEAGKSAADLYIAGEILHLDPDRTKLVTDILTSLAYDKNLLCNCQPEYKLVTANGDSYGIHLEEGYTLCDKGQAKLTAQQLKVLSSVIDWAFEQTKER